MYPSSIVFNSPGIWLGLDDNWTLDPRTIIPTCLAHRRSTISPIEPPDFSNKSPLWDGDYLSTSYLREGRTVYPAMVAMIFVWWSVNWNTEVLENMYLFYSHSENVCELYVDLSIRLPNIMNSRISNRMSSANKALVGDSMYLINH